MRSVALVQDGDGKWCWPSLDHINAALATGGAGDTGVRVSKIEPYREGMAKRGYVKVFCAQDEKLSSAYRSFFGEGEHAFNNCLLIAPAKSAHRVEVFTLRWLAEDGSHWFESENIASLPGETEGTGSLEGFYQSH